MLNGGSAAPRVVSASFDGDFAGQERMRRVDAGVDDANGDSGAIVPDRPRLIRLYERSAVGEIGPRHQKGRRGPGNAPPLRIDPLTFRFRPAGQFASGRLYRPAKTGLDRLNHQRVWGLGSSPAYYAEV